MNEKIPTYVEWLVSQGYDLETLAARKQLRDKNKIEIANLRTKIRIWRKRLDEAYAAENLSDVRKAHKKLFSLSYDMENLLAKQPIPVKRQELPGRSLPET